MTKLIDQEKIEKEFNNQIEELQKSIERIGMKQDELKSYIVDLTTSIQEIKMQLSTLGKDEHERKVKLYIAIQKNSELISRFYETISSFEVVRQRYQQDIGKLTKDKVSILNIEIRKVENKLEGSSNSLVTFMKELRQLVSSATENPEVSRKIIDSFENHPEYSLD